MKTMLTASVIGVLGSAVAAATPPSLQFHTIANSVDEQPLAYVSQLISETGGGVTAVVVDDSFETHLVDHPGTAGSGLAARSLLGAGADYAYFGPAAVSNSPTLGRVVTFSANDYNGDSLFQHVVATGQTHRLHDPAELGDYFPLPYDVTPGGQVLHTAYIADAGHVVRSRVTPSGVVRDIEDRYFDRQLGFTNYIAPGGDAYIVHHPPAGPERQILRSRMDPSITPETLAGPTLSISGIQTHPYKLLGANDNQVLFTAIADAPGGQDAVYLRTDNAGVVSYQTLFTAPTVGEDFYVAGLLTPAGRAVMSVQDADSQVHLSYWSGSERFDWAATPGLTVQLTAPMIGDGGDWVVFYAILDDPELFVPAIMAWNPVMGIDPFVLLQTGGQIDLAGEGPVTIADLLLMGDEGVLKDALSDGNELAVAFRREGSDFYEIAGVTLPVPEPRMLPMLLVFLPLLRRRH